MSNNSNTVKNSPSSSARKSSDLSASSCDLAEGNRLPGSFEGSDYASAKDLPDMVIGSSVAELYHRASRAFNNVKDSGDKAYKAFDKFAELMEAIDIDHIKTIVDGARKVSALGGDFSDTINQFIETLKNPAVWVKYGVPIILGVGIYLIVKERSGVLVPLMKALCVAGAAYFVIPEVDRLLHWLSHLSQLKFQGPSFKFGSNENLKIDEDSFLSPLINKITRSVYGIDFNLKQVIYVLSSVPKTLDGVHRIWSMITSLWAEIKVRVCSFFGWEVKSGDLGIDRLVDSANDLILQLKTDKLPFTHGLAMRIDELANAHTAMISKLAADNKGALMSYVKTSLEAIKKAQIEIHQRVGTGYTNRVEPVMIVLYGKPGQGKTVFSQELEKALLKKILTSAEWEAYKENGRNFVFTVPPGLKHWETVQNTTKIVRIDELWQEREVAGMEASQSLLIQQLINTAPFTPPMAFDRKGMVSLEPAFVICTTNVQSINHVHTLEAPRALTRRMHFLVEVEKGNRPFDEVIDLTNIKLTMCEVDDNGNFKKESRPMDAPELVELILDDYYKNARKQRASYANADVQSNFLLGLEKDPARYLANLKTDIESKKVVPSVVDPHTLQKIAKDINDDYGIDMYDCDSNDAAWKAFTTMSLPEDESDFKLCGRHFSRKSVIGRFVTFCRITGIAWSLEKFLNLIDRTAYIVLMDMPFEAYRIWMTTYYDDFLEGVFDKFKLVTDLKDMLLNVPSLIGNWIDKIIPSYLKRIDLLFSVGTIAITTWYFSDQIKKMFYSDEDYMQSEEKFLRKGQKAIHRDKKYLFRMVHEEDNDYGPRHSEDLYAMQAGDRLPEIAKNTYVAIADNVYVLTNDKVVDRLGFVLFVKEDLVLMPCHFAQILNQILDDYPDETHYVTFTNSRGSYKVLVKELLEAGFGDLPREYFVTKVNLGRQHRDITMHFPNSTEINKFQVDFRNHMDLAVKVDDVAYLSPSTYHHTAVLHGGDGEMRKVNSVVRVKGIDFKFGDCGLLYVALTGPAAGKIVGMHVGGNTLYHQGVGIFLTKQSVLDWFRNVHKGKIITFNEPRRVILDDIFPVDRVSYTNANCQYAGNGPVVDYAKTNVRITKEGIDARLANYDKAKPTSYNLEHIHDCTRLLGARILQNFSGGCKRLSLHDSIWGSPGEFSSIDMSTSVGFPLQGSGLDKKKWRNEDMSMNQDVMQELRRLVNTDISDYMAHVYPNHVFKIFPKDEKLPIFDVTEKNKVRTINGGPILHIIEQRMFFGDFVRRFEEDSLELNHLIGINLNSMDGDDLARKLISMDPTGQHFFGGDISKFEFNQKYDIQMSIFDNVVAPTLTDMSESERQVARMIWDHSSMSTHKWDDKLYMVNGCRASGEYLTSTGNSLYVIVSIIYSYYKAFGFNLSILRTFFDHVYLVAMGDDQIGGVDDEVKDVFNQFAIRDGLADLGLTYTDPSKDEITKAFIPFKDLVMLQCTPRYDAGLGRYVWAQHLHSIIEISQWTVKEQKKPNLNIWQSNVFESLKKLCIHPKSIWDEYVPKYQKMVCGLGVDIPTWDYRTMQAIVFGEDSLRARYKFEYAKDPAITFEIQGGRFGRTRSGQPIPPNVVYIHVSPWGRYNIINWQFAETYRYSSDVLLDYGDHCVLLPFDSDHWHGFWRDYNAQTIFKPRPMVHLRPKAKF